MLDIKNIQTFYGKIQALRDVSIKVNTGEIVSLIGANGAGKTSLFKLILNELEADQGSVEKPDGLRISHLAQEVAGTDEIAIDSTISIAPCGFNIMCYIFF